MLLGLLLRPIWHRAQNDSTAVGRCLWGTVHLWLWTVSLSFWFHSDGANGRECRLRCWQRALPHDWRRSNDMRWTGRTDFFQFACWSADFWVLLLLLWTWRTLSVLNGTRLLLHDSRRGHWTGSVFRFRRWRVAALLLNVFLDPVVTLRLWTRCGLEERHRIGRNLNLRSATHRRGLKGLW